MTDVAGLDPMVARPPGSLQSCHDAQGPGLQQILRPCIGLASDGPLAFQSIQVVRASSELLVNHQ